MTSTPAGRGISWLYSLWVVRWSRLALCRLEVQAFVLWGSGERSGGEDFEDAATFSGVSSVRRETETKVFFSRAVRAGYFVVRRMLHIAAQAFATAVTALVSSGAYPW